MSEGPLSVGGEFLDLTLYGRFRARILRESTAIFIADRAPLRHLFRQPQDMIFHFIFKALRAQSGTLRGVQIRPSARRFERGLPPATTGHAGRLRHIGLVTLFVVVDPVGLVPTFLAVTEGLPHRARRSVALRASIIAGRILIGTALLGDALFARSESATGVPHRRGPAPVLNRV